jgi:hypothetical protein
VDANLLKDLSQEQDIDEVRGTSRYHHMGIVKHNAEECMLDGPGQRMMSRLSGAIPSPGRMTATSSEVGKLYRR